MLVLCFHLYFSLLFNQRISVMAAEESKLEEKIDRVVPRFCTSFPQLHFSSDGIGVERFQSNPCLSHVSSLGKKLAETIKKNREGMSVEAVNQMAVRCHGHVMNARRSYAATTKKDLNGEPVVSLLGTYEMLLSYLVSGKLSELDSVGKCLELVALAKNYNFCSDQMVSLVLDILKSLVNTQNVVQIIIAVGHNSNEGGKQNFEVGDPFFFQYAIDNGHEVFAKQEEGDTKLYNGSLVASTVVTQFPSIATRLLVQMPATFWEKTKPAKVEEHDEVDE